MKDSKEKKEQHTPGPWRFNKCQCGDELCDAYYISSLSKSGRCSKSDAQLITAAPELLKALEVAAEIVTKMIPLQIATAGELSAECKADIQVITDVLVKVRGESGI